MTGEDFGYKPGVVWNAKFEHSSLGKVFNKWLDESDKKEGLLKRLKHTESKNEDQLKMTENKKRKNLAQTMQKMFMMEGR